VCQRHSRAIKVLGLASAFCLMLQVSQAKVFSVEEVKSVFMIGSFLFWILVNITFEMIINPDVLENIG